MRYSEVFERVSVSTQSIFVYELIYEASYQIINSATFVVLHFQSLHAATVQWVELSGDTASVEVDSFGIQEFSGGLVGGTSMVSDPIDAPEVQGMWRNYEILRPAHTETTRLHTLGQSPYNEVFGFAAQRIYGDFAVYNLYNPRHAEDDHRNQKANDPEYTKAVSIEFAEAGLPAGENCVVFDF